MRGTDMCGSIIWIKTKMTRNYEMFFRKGQKDRVEVAGGGVVLRDQARYCWEIRAENYEMGSSDMTRSQAKQIRDGIRGILEVHRNIPLFSI